MALAASAKSIFRKKPSRTPGPLPLAHLKSHSASARLIQTRARPESAALPPTGQARVQRPSQVTMLYPVSFKANGSDPLGDQKRNPLITSQPGRDPELPQNLPQGTAASGKDQSMQGCLSVTQAILASQVSGPPFHRSHAFRVFFCKSAHTPPLPHIHLPSEQLKHLYAHPWGGASKSQGLPQVKPFGYNVDTGTSPMLFLLLDLPPETGLAASPGTGN